MSYISPHFKGVVSIPCKTQKTEAGKVLLHVTQIRNNSCLMFTKVTNMIKRQNKLDALYKVKLNNNNNNNNLYFS